MNNWSLEYLSSAPQEFQQVNENTYIQRRNIVPNENEEIGGYVCESRFITKEDYNALNQADNALVIMEMIADLYEKIDSQEVAE